MRQKVLWWCMWGIGSIFWSVLLIQIVLANNETGIIKADSNKTTHTLIQKPAASESTSVSTSNPVESIVPADTKKTEPVQQDNAGKKDDAKNKDACINVNTANADELVSLQGIGPVLAQRIVEFRKENGDFKDESDLVKVKGIGEAKLNKIRDRICL